MNFLNRLERRVDIADELGVFARAVTIDQAGDIEPRSVERLKDVVARRSEETRLGDIGRSPATWQSAQFGRSGVLSSRVRLRTRTSSEAFARSRASAASTLGVMSVSVVTMLPPGIGLLRTSTTMLRSANRSRNGSMPCA